MNRRRFLSFLGLAPVAAALPAMALPRPERLMATGGVVKGKVDYLLGETPSEGIFIDASKSGPTRLIIDFDALNQGLAEHLKWTTESFHQITGDLERLGRYQS